MRGSITKRGDSWLIRFDVGMKLIPRLASRNGNKRVSRLGVKEGGQCKINGITQICTPQ